MRWNERKRSSGSTEGSRLRQQVRLLGRPALSGAVKAVTYVVVLHALGGPSLFSLIS